MPIVDLPARPTAATVTRLRFFSFTPLSLETATELLDEERCVTPPVHRTMAGKGLKASSGVPS